MAQEEVKITFTIDGIEKEVKSVEELQKEMQKLGKETKKVGEENKFVADAKKKWKDFKDGIRGATAGFKGLKGAIAATGLGALLIAITSLVAYFKNSEEGSRKLAIAMEALGIITGKITDFFAALGEKIMWAFTHPKEAILKLKDLIVANITERVQSLIDMFGYLGSAIMKVFKGDFKGALEDAKSAGSEFVDTLTGVDNTLEKVGDTAVQVFQTIKKETLAAVDAATKLVDLQRALRNQQQALIVENAKLNKEMETQQKIAEDTTRSYDERKEALEKVGEAQVKLAENIANQAALEENLIRLQIQQEGNYEKREELETQLAEAVASRIEAETALETKKLDVSKITAELDQEELDRKQTIRDILESAELEQIENEFQRALAENALAEQQAMEELDRLKATEEEKQKVREYFAGEKNKINKASADYEMMLQQAIVDNNLSLAQGAFSALSGLLGKESAAGKAAAIASTTIQTYQAAQGAYKSQMALPTPDAPVRAAVAAGVAIAQGLANVKAIVSTKVPGGGGSGGAGGSTPRNTTVAPVDPTAGLAEALGNQTQEGQQIGINQSAAGNVPVMKAYVVSEEMSSAQEANAKINDLARL